MEQEQGDGKGFEPVAPVAGGWQPSRYDLECFAEQTAELLQSIGWGPAQVSLGPNCCELFSHLSELYELTRHPTDQWDQELRKRDLSTVNFGPVTGDPPRSGGGTCEPAGFQLGRPASLPHL